MCKQILESCHCPSLKDNFTNVMLKLETYLIYFTQDSTNNLEVTLMYIMCGNEIHFNENNYLGFGFNR